MNQLVLPLRLADHAVFASFYSHGNESLVATLRELAGGAGGREAHGCWLWGPESAGKTHLLQAVCDRAGDRSVYIPLSKFAVSGPGILEGLASRELVCIDDVETVVGDADWEAALFDLCNQLFDAGSQLIVAAGMAPRECPIRLADLASRLSRLPVFHVHALDDEHRVTALQLRARHRGLDLPGETARYLLKRSRRDMASLYGLLDKLDLEALRAQRRLTVPFVRDVLNLPENG
ncbi:MAG: DnaA regulatory inactivator Hda [Gammaproteobacteria bacterium]|nr:DnaA regulatory inactivator Hda [Gammaproteobacteria bacterium]MDH3363060.1 DnaA regulatory inactivator Hda [Gammaproteobacteria bacterium]MDH3481114.1 DnaA regulatory inactivator Hda [Gammaproteobacteria bacterium]